MISIIPSDTGYVHKKMVYGEFVVSLVRASWEAECIVSLVLAGEKVEEQRFGTSLSTAVAAYEMFSNMAKKIGDHYNQTSIYLRRHDEESSAIFNDV